MFRRRRKDGDESQETVDAAATEKSQEDAQEGDAADVVTDHVPDADALSSGAAARSGGPYDADEAPEDEIPRIDLGSLRVPMVDGLEVRIDMDQQTQEPAQLVLSDGESLLQLAAFAAPRTAGIWAEVRAEIAESLTAAGGAAEESEGFLGPELMAQVPTGEPGGGLAPARFVGVDKPRWFLRGLLSGPAAVDPQRAEKLEFVIRGTIVVRGKDAMPIRDPLPLKLPPEAQAMADEQLAAEGGAPTLEQLDPGPTITETR